MSEYVSCLVTLLGRDTGTIVKYAIKIKASNFPGDPAHPMEFETMAGLRELLPYTQHSTTVVKVEKIDDVITL